MKIERIVLLSLFIIGVSPVLGAQEEIEEKKDLRKPAVEEPRFEVWLKGHGLLFDNFFQATEGVEETDVEALYGEVGASVLLGGVRTPVRAYLSGNTVQYQEDALDSSDGFRIGLRGGGRPHSFEVYFDQQMDRPTFDVGDVFDRADVSTLSGDYGYRVTRNWEVKAQAEFQQQDFDLTPIRDNEYTEIGAALRYRGWDYSPEIGIATGERDVDDPTSSYDQDEVYIQVRAPLTPRLYASARLRFRDRTYTTDDLNSSNFGRADDRKQLSGYAVYELFEFLSLDFYGSYEDVESNQTGRDFDTSMLLFGATLHY